MPGAIGHIGVKGLTWWYPMQSYDKYECIFEAICHYYCTEMKNIILHGTQEGTMYALIPSQITKNHGHLMIESALHS